EEGELWVPVSGEPASPQRLRLSISDSSGITLRTDATGKPVVAAIVGDEDGLRLAFAGPAVIYERLNALPRVRWMSASRVVPRRPDRLHLLKQSASRSIVLLHAPAPQASGRP